MNGRVRILMLEDNPDDAELVLRELKRGGLEFEVTRVHDEPGFLQALADKPDLVLSDYALPQFDGLTALIELKKRHPEIPFILISGAIGEELAVAAMREGAADYLLKDRLSRLPTAVRTVVSQASLTRENRQLEERLLRAARLESLGRLSAGIAHDLNNILLPIMMAEQLLREEVQTPSALELLQTIETSAVRGARVLKQLLTFGRGTNGQRVPLRLDRAIAEIRTVMRETFPKDMTVRTEITHADATVFADPTQLQQILLNLCVNARDAMRAGGGTLTIGVRLGEVSPQLAAKYPGAEPGLHAVLSVKDSGTGIEPEHLENIFDPFFTTKGLEHGTGLGLSSVLGIVQSYGGFIQVESELGRGTEFSVWLRACEGNAATETHPVHPGRLTGRGELVLLVDDEPAVLDVLASSIGRYGYRVIVAPDGVSALELLDKRSAEVAVVVADLAMPRMDGVRLANEIRSRHAALSVVIMTAALSSEKRSSLATLGVNEILIKPFQAETLLVSLQRVLGTSRQRKSMVQA